MSNWRLTRLDFGRSPVHFGEVGIGVEQSSERVRSDTLFSAWANAYVRLFGVDEIEELFKKFPIAKKIKDSDQSDNTKDQLKSITPVKFSSTFIYTKELDNYKYYLPHPTKVPVDYPDTDLKFFKAYKKIKYLPLDVWQRWYQGTGIQADIPELTLKTTVKETKGALANSGVFSYGKTYKTETYPKVSIDRRTAATNFYHTGFTQFNYEPNKRSGLYFLLHFPEANSELEDKLHAALNLLGENGLGGERSSGAGRFEVEYWGNLPTKWQDVVDFPESEHHCLLSLFWRASLEPDFLDNSSYELIERGGWIGSPFSGRQLRRNKVYMFAEGSVFKSFKSLPVGYIADVTPHQFIKKNLSGKPEYNPHPIYRSGISLSIPIKVKSEGSE